MLWYGSDAWTVKVEFCGLILNEFKNRSFKDSYPKRLPRRGDSINFLIFGIVLDQSFQHGGPGVYGLQHWVYELVRGLDKTEEQIMTLITKHDIPKHVVVGDLIELINKLINTKPRIIMLLIFLYK